MTCKHCNKDVPQKEGRRARLYCDDKCKRLFHKKPKETITLTMDKYNALLEQLKVVSKNSTPLPVDKLAQVASAKSKKAVEKAILPTIEKLPGESAIDYAIRKEEAKKPSSSLTSLLP